MRVFSIGSTDFAVDGTKSRIRLDVQGDGMLEVHVDIHGDEAVFERLADVEDGEWSWRCIRPCFSCTACAWRKARRARPQAAGQGRRPLTMRLNRAST